MRLLAVAVAIGIVVPTVSAQDANKTPPTAAQQREREANKNLALACRKGEVAKVAALLKAGADVNGQTSDNKTPLMWAACYGHLKVVEALIAAHADLEAEDSLGGTAIVYATAGVHDDVISLLKAKGAKPSTLDGMKLAMWALGQPSGPGDVYDYLAERAKLKKKDP